MLEIDATLLVAFVIVWILVFVLNRVFFRPMRRTMDERAARIKGDRDEAARNAGESQAGLQEIDQAVRSARQAAERLREEIAAAAIQEKARLLAEVSTDAKARIEDSRARLAVETDRLREELKAEAAGLARRIEERLLD